MVCGEPATEKITSTISDASIQWWQSIKANVKKKSARQLLTISWKNTNTNSNYLTTRIGKEELRRENQMNKTSTNASQEYIEQKHVRNVRKESFFYFRFFFVLRLLVFFGCVIVDVLAVVIISFLLPETRTKIHLTLLSERNVRDTFLGSRISIAFSDSWLDGLELDEIFVVVLENQSKQNQRIKTLQEWKYCWVSWLDYTSIHIEAYKENRQMCRRPQQTISGSSTGKKKCKPLCGFRI